jgi:hypothetical protein
MPSFIAFDTTEVKAVFEMAASAIPSALAEIAEFMKLIMLASSELGSPPQFGVGRPRQGFVKVGITVREC